MKVLRMTADFELTAHEWPKKNDYNTTHKFLTGLIGNGCRTVEHVAPEFLYSDLGCQKQVTDVPGMAVSMLVDKEFLLRNEGEVKLNHVALYLYGAHLHGQPILGTVVFVGEYWDEGSLGIGFCGIENNERRRLQEQLEALCGLMKFVSEE